MSFHAHDAGSIIGSSVKFRPTPCCSSGWAISTRLFFGDAEEGSRLLDLTLTQRQGTPMCGMPYHAAEGYIAQILKAGRRRGHLRP